MLVSLVYVLVCRLFELVVLFTRGERSKELEILVLRHELSILRRPGTRPQHEPRDRLLLAALEPGAAASFVAGRRASARARRCCVASSLGPS